MRIETVTAAGFGPLVRQTLQLAPGMTVVAGPNEAGKSSWHAAAYAALCGRRRGRGRPTAAEQAFIDAHQPWNGAPWAVSSVLELDDGRRVEMRHDLSGKVDCRATDIELARDVSAEIMVDGSPDASAWLGLTRESFRATACVAQADILGVLEAADGLQRDLQRAASTAGTSGTAARAIELLEAHRRAAVGRDVAGTSRPLRRAREAVTAAEQELERARRAHALLDEVSQDAARLSEAAQTAELSAQEAAADAAAAGAQLRAAEERALRAAVPAVVVAGGAFGPESGRRIAVGDGQAAEPDQRRMMPVGAAPTRASAFARVLAGASGWRMALLGMLAGLAAVLVIAAVVGGFVAVTVAAVVCAGIAGWLSWGFRARGGGSAAGSAEPPAVLPPVLTSPDAVVSSEVLQLRYEWAERQALADAARRRHHEAAVSVSRADAVLLERSAALPAVADAEEALAAAQRELRRVLDLDDTLTLTIGFLERAQERVHREVAPELTTLLRAWLPALTDGRYTDARLDPAVLRVEVAGADGEFRPAHVLSRGTSEQVYLLLRVAMAARITAGHDSCPLLLDDVTVHADARRTHRLLELLHELSGERQVVLFAAQEQVREWAQERLTAERDGLVVLPRPG